MMAKSIFITGATSGIGEAVAKRCAARGYSLALTGRREMELARVKQDIEAANADARVEIASLDVTDYDQVPVVFNDLLKRLGRIDVAFVNAGVNLMGTMGEGSFEDYRRIVETNLIGAIATIEAAVTCFRQQGGGHVVAVSSVAAWRGLPGAGAYTATKAGLDGFMESARSQFAFDRKMRFTTVFPGFVKTPMVEKIRTRPFELTAEKAARKIVRGIERRSRHIYVPWWPWRLLRPIAGWLPDSVVNFIARLQ